MEATGGGQQVEETNRGGSQWWGKPFVFEATGEGSHGGGSHWWGKPLMGEHDFDWRYDKLRQTNYFSNATSKSH